MNVGYFFWGHLGDKLTYNTIDTPDGNAWYSFVIINELMNCFGENNFVNLSLDRDEYDYSIYSDNIFNSFMKNERINAYKANRVRWDLDKIEIINPPDLDLIILEWRFPINSRNTLNDRNNKNFQPDLLMQEFILKYYKKQKIIILDLDYKLTLEDEKKLKEHNNIIIFETSNNVKKQVFRRIPVEIPFYMTAKILERKNYNLEIIDDIVYVGSRYERDNMIEKYIIPYSKKHLYKVSFYGNWRKYPEKFEELMKKGWTEIKYYNRVGHKDFNKIYSSGLACPLLAKDEYNRHGFMTARIQESLFFGCVPIGFKDFFNIEKYLPDFLIVDENNTIDNVIDYIRNSDIDDLRQKVWNKLEFMDIRYFIDKILEVLNEF